MKPTIQRTYAFLDHQPPAKGRIDADGKLWHGHSRCTDKPARQRANARSWAALKADRRRAHLASKAAQS